MIDGVADQHRDRLDMLAGLMSAAAIFVGIFGMTNFDLSVGGSHFEMRPIRIGVASVTLALVAAGIGGRHRRLAAIAVGITGVAWALGMVIAVLTQHPAF